MEIPSGQDSFSLPAPPGKTRHRLSADGDDLDDVEFEEEPRRYSYRKRSRVEYRETAVSLDNLTDDEGGGGHAGPSIQLRDSSDLYYGVGAGDAAGGDMGALSNDEQQNQLSGPEDMDDSTDEGLSGAAYASRCPPNSLTDQEKHMFPDVHRAPYLHKPFIYFRNFILHMFLSRPQYELTLDSVRSHVDSSRTKNHQDLLERVFQYLTRVGLINFGVYRRMSPIVELDVRPRVIVIGAGVAGLAAARQLISFGFEVVVLEARKRVGGRVASFRKENFVADLGAMVLTGLGGNPLAVLSKQISMDLFRIRQTCPLYDTSGEPVPKSVDVMVEKEFNRLLEASAYLAHHLNFSHIGSKELSVGQALEMIIKLQERHVKAKHLEHLKRIAEAQDMLKALQNEMITTQTNIHSAQARLANATSPAAAVAADGSDFELRGAHYDLQTAFKVYDSQLVKRQELEIRLQQLEENIPSEVYLSIRDRQILDWHIANLEFANATPLSTVSLKYWDQDDDFEFSGPHMTVRTGYSQLPSKLAEDLDIRYETPVRNISYTEHGVEVIASNPTPASPPIVHTANAVLVTVPLGVLKCNSIVFNPPLPGWKADAIRRMGFGNLNKVILCFEKAFWDPTVNLFGHVNPSTADRGECFLFWNIYRAPTLIALIAGESATNLEHLPDDVVVGKALEALRHIFTEANVPTPVNSIVTRWRTDQWARGSYSYVAVGSSGADYDFMAAPVTNQDASKNSNPTLFFAGEHTMRNYPATVHGALLSGIREAGRIADLMLGAPYSRSGATSAAAADTASNGTAPATADLPDEIKPVGTAMNGATTAAAAATTVSSASSNSSSS
eukprot:scpid45307/ scgid0286/ Lysine-specific histone demethylase 1A; BRAF35-HDAC complex protein BHC110; Flavin-containing amine oxidase domain-containing protein 2